MTIDTLLWRFWILEKREYARLILLENASHQLMMDLSHPDFLRCGSWAHGRMHARGPSLELCAWDGVELGYSPVLQGVLWNSLLIRLSPNKAEITLEGRGNDPQVPSTAWARWAPSPLTNFWFVYSGSLGSELHQAHCHLPNSSLSLGIGNHPLPRQYTLSPNAFQPHEHATSGYTLPLLLWGCMSTTPNKACGGIFSQYLDGWLARKISPCNWMTPESSIALPFRGTLQQRMFPNPRLNC